MKILPVAAGFLVGSQASQSPESKARRANGLSEIICNDCEKTCRNMGHNTNACISRCQTLQKVNCEHQDQPKTRSNLREDWWSAMALDSIDGYGCWCYFDDEIDSAHGATQNGMDALCKQLVKGYYCMELDDGSCDPVNVAYTSANSEASDLIDAGSEADAAYLAACTSVNTGDCAIRACAVEGYFLYNMIDFFFGGSTFDKSLLHSKNQFDYTTECAQTGGTPRDSYTCCGTYPLRSRYKEVASVARTCCAQHYLVDSGTQQCCDNINTYDSGSHECCNDGDGTNKEIGRC